MNKPYFEVGEEVIAIFKHYPESNGRYIITEVLSNRQAKEEVQRSSKFKCDFYYRLDGLLLVWAEGTEGEVKFDLAGEPALRKIHKPSQFSFDQLISEIKCPHSITQ